MKYFVTFAGRTIEVEVSGGAGGRVGVDGVELEARLAPVTGAPTYHLLVGGESRQVAAEFLAAAGDGGRSRWALGVAGERFEVDVVDERTRQLQALTGRRGAGTGAVVIRAPMPGLVVRVEVERGQMVDAGRGLVVVEAMKMENELRAPQPGTVSQVHVASGQRVEKGAPLVTLESVEPSG